MSDTTYKLNLTGQEVQSRLDQVNENKTALEENSKADLELKAKVDALKVPTKVSELENDSNYVDATIVDDCAKVSELELLKEQFSKLTDYVLEHTDTADLEAITSYDKLNYPDKNVVIKSNQSGEPAISGSVGITAASAVVKDIELITKNAKFSATVNSQLKLSNVQFEAPYERVREGDTAKYNCGIILKSTDSLYIHDVTLTEEACTGRYNAIEIDLSDKTGVKYVDINNVRIEGTLSNNGILIFNVQDGAIINIKNVYIKECSNPIRFSNGLNAKNVTINIENMTVDQWDKSKDWRGLIILEDYTSPADKALENNLFSKDKITINIKNLVHAGKKILPTSDEEIFGYESENRVIYRVLDYVDGSNSNIYSEETRAMYPPVKFE